MNTKHSRFIAFLLLVFVPTGAFSFENLSDLQLDAVAAGSVGPEHELTEEMFRIPFRYSGRKGSVDGEVVVVPMATYTQASSLQLTGNAQANLQSLININAVSSPIQVLLNLNISVNSNIGNVNQLNNLLSSSVP